MKLDLDIIRTIFFEESLESLAEIESALLELNIDQSSKQNLDKIFRGIHSIKGNAGIFEMTDVVGLAHSIESLLDRMRTGSCPLTSEGINHFLYSVDLLKNIILASQAHQQYDSQAVKDCQALLSSHNPLASQFNQDKKPLTAQSRPEVNALSAQTVRIKTRKLDNLIHTIGKLVTTQASLEQELLQYLEQVNPLHSKLGQLKGHTQQLQDQIMLLRMLPISYAFNRLPRLVYDVSNQLGKQVMLKISGEHTEVDKSILEQLNDPLVHLIRNALDHGIETPAARQAQHKAETGTIYLHATNQGNELTIEIEDDGIGLDTQRIVKKAIAQKRITAEQVVDDDLLQDLIFQPGFSSNDQVTLISGRGVGLDVVQKRIHSMGGHIEVHSQANKGCRFVIRLPISVSIMESQRIQVGLQEYMVPQLAVIDSFTIQADHIHQLSNQDQVYKWQELYIPILCLSDYLKTGCCYGMDTSQPGILVILKGQGKYIALFIKSLDSPQTTVLRSLETHYHPIKGISGATILGNGKLLLMLDVPALIRLFKN